MSKHLLTWKGWEQNRNVVLAAVLALVLSAIIVLTPRAALAEVTVAVELVDCEPEFGQAHAAFAVYDNGQRVRAIQVLEYSPEEWLVGTYAFGRYPSILIHGPLDSPEVLMLVKYENWDFTTGGQFEYAWLNMCSSVPLDPPGEPTTGLVDPDTGKWHLYDEFGAQTDSFYYGNPGDYPFMGDWNGDGTKTPGLYRQSDGYVYLRNSNSGGVAEIKFFFGNPGDVPIAGDFNDDGFDTVSIYRPANQTFYIINKLGSNDGGLGEAEFSYVFGNPGDKPFVGDFDGDGIFTLGLHRESTGLVYFRNSHTQGNADSQFIFGDPGDRLIAGDWTDDSVSTPALFRPTNTTMYFRHSNSQGNADAQWSRGVSDRLPVSLR